MKIQDILVHSLTDYAVEEWDDRPLFYNYTRLRSYILAQPGFPKEYFNLFATPRLAGEKLTWQTEAFTDTPVKLSSLSGEMHAAYKNILRTQINAFNQLIVKIRKEGKEKGWADLLAGALICSGEDSVYCANGTVVIAPWSMAPQKTRDWESGLFSEEVPGEDKQGIDRKPLPDNQVEAEQPSEPPIDAPSGNPDEADIPLPAGETPATTAPVSKDEPGVPVDQPPANPTPPEDTGKEAETLTVHEVPRKSNEKVKDAIRPPGNVPPAVVLPGAKKKRFPWWKILLVLMASLLILLLLFLLLRSCNRTPGPVAGPPELPETPGVIVPIDSADLGYSHDSMTMVATNRLNILLEGHSTIEQFARDFKTAYPDTNYQIIYYDTIVKRLQIQVPEAVKERLKTEIHQKITNHEFFVWDEALFEKSYIPHDPAMSIRSESWYQFAVKAPGAWDKTMGSQDIIVAIVDDGFDLNHPEIKNSIVKPFNVYTKDSQVTPGKHGTHVAGIALALNDNGQGFSGIAPKCRFMPIQVASPKGVMTTTGVMDGVLYAIYHGADVINLSLGMQFTIASPLPIGIQKDLIKNNYLEEEKVWDEIFKIASRFNTVIVMASGNDNILTGIDPMQRNPYGIKVAAVNPDFSKAVFSNFGDHTTVSAPGVHIYSSIPGNHYEFLDGTSMASPIVTGGVALLKSLNKSLTAPEIAKILIETGARSTNRNIANIIQLDRAVGLVKSGKVPVRGGGNCDDISRRIDSLQKLIDDLRNQCGSANQDTMRMPEIISNPASLNGRWKSTTHLHNDAGEDVTIIFEFKNGQGSISFNEPGNLVCTAPVSVKVDKNVMSIDQKDDAACGNSKKYGRYSFRCVADKNGYADCVGQNKAVAVNRFNFNLIKIN